MSIRQAINHLKNEVYGLIEMDNRYELESVHTTLEKAHEELDGLMIKIADHIYRKRLNDDKPA